MLERMLIPKIENRILVGIVAFVGTMVLLGWAAINEGGRMAALETSYHARSIELGAELFAANCSRCHGPDGRGLANFGPGLNNPQFFAVDFFPEITAQINQFQGEQVGLNAERGAAATTDARKAEIDARIAEIDAQIAELSAERDQQLQTAISLGYDPQRPDRLRNVGWAGTRDSFILTTLIHGRPTSINYWPNGAMPAWSQTAGGPLRMDQLEDLTNYILNWDKGDNWTLEDLLAVKQFAKEPADPAPLRQEIDRLQAALGGVELPSAIGTDVSAATQAIAELTGDAARGDRLYHSLENPFGGAPLGCNGCHQQSANGTGPMTDGTWTRVVEQRLQEPQFQGHTPEQYLVESIIQPGSYIVPGFQNVMLATFGQQLSAQDLADIIAYLETLTQPQ